MGFQRVQIWNCKHQQDVQFSNLDTKSFPVWRKNNVHATATQYNFCDNFCKISASFYDYLGGNNSKTKLIHVFGVWNSKDANMLNKMHLLNAWTKDHWILSMEVFPSNKF